MYLQAASNDDKHVIQLRQTIWIEKKDKCRDERKCIELNVTLERLLVCAQKIKEKVFPPKQKKNVDVISNIALTLSEEK